MTSAVGNDQRGGRGNRAINIGKFKTCKARTEFGKRGGEKEEKTIMVPTILKLACENINGWNPGSVAAGGVGSITLLRKRP
jgi:hypothetical protein